jgi:Lar family restriction alleviation protein
MELKPCPFCGGEPQVFACDGAGCFYTSVGTAQIMGRKTDHKLIRCKKCGIRTKAYLTDKGVFNAWNRRADND